MVPRIALWLPEALQCVKDRLIMKALRTGFVLAFCSAICADRSARFLSSISCSMAVLEANLGGNDPEFFHCAPAVFTVSGCLTV